MDQAQIFDQTVDCNCRSRVLRLTAGAFTAKVTCEDQFSGSSFFVAIHGEGLTFDSCTYYIQDGVGVSELGGEKV